MKELSETKTIYVPHETLHALLTREYLKKGERLTDIIEESEGITLVAIVKH